MATKNFKPGDLVELKSGGPIMTVDAVFDGGDCRCVWFAGEKQQNHVFSGATLKAAE
jgi:uncharacterized protein YodC (DUF2158 family)